MKQVINAIVGNPDDKLHAHKSYELCSRAPVVKMNTFCFKV